MKRSLFLLPLFFLIMAFEATAGQISYNSSSVDGTLAFRAHTSLFGVNGRFNIFGARAQVDHRDLESSTLNLTFDTNSVDTENGTRDNHLRAEDFFYVSRYPKATFNSKSITKQGKKQFTVVGDLTLRGVTKEVAVPVTLIRKLRNGQIVYNASGKLTLNRHDFGIDYKAGLLMPSVKSNVDISFNLLLKPAN